MRKPGDFKFKSWTLNPDVQKKFLDLGTFIETGTFEGGGVNQAIELGFSEIHTVEIDPQYYRDAEQRFQHYDFVRCWFGDSAQILPGVLRLVSNPALIFLDSHDQRNSSIIADLKALAETRVRHTIIIDDVDFIVGQIKWGKLVCPQDLFGAVAALPKYNIEVLDSIKRKKSQWLLTPIN